MRTFGLLAALVLLTACDDAVRLSDGRTYDCVGIFEDRDDRVRYRVDKSNVFVAAVFVETLIVPAVVVADQLWCPVSLRAKP
jgi:hypothetical protein